MRANAAYVLLYASGIYGLVLAPPVQTVVGVIADPLRDSLAPVVDPLPLIVRCILALLAYDVLAYWVHRAAHASPLLWRFHRIHHVDPDFGPMTTFRFHVAEIAWRMAVQFFPLAILGVAASIPPGTYAVLLLFNVLAHADTHWTYGTLGRAIVSPAFHRVHHRGEKPANFGMYFVWWDRWFGTAS